MAGQKTTGQQAVEGENRLEEVVVRTRGEVVVVSVEHCQ